MPSTVYATLEQLSRSGVAPDALRKMDDAVKLTALSQASAVADQSLASRYSLPLASWGDDLIQIVCIIAGYRLLTYQGLAPGEGHPLTTLYKEAIQTLRDVAVGRAALNVVDTAPDPTFEPDMHCNEPRGL